VSRPAAARCKSRTNGEPEYSEYASRLRAEWPELADFTGVRCVLEWMQRRGLAYGVDMVGQDEFHYDFLIALEPDGRWMVFGVT
jgi:hypothetical protein